MSAELDPKALEAATEALWSKLKVSDFATLSEATKRWPGPDMLPAGVQNDAQIAIRAYLAAAPASPPVDIGLVEPVAWIDERALAAFLLATPTDTFTATVVSNSQNGKPVEPLYSAAALAAVTVRAEAAERANATRPDYDLRCQDCGRAHILDTVVPSEIWNQIADPSDLLCAVCIDRRLAANGLKAEAKFYYGGDALQSKLYADDKDPESALIEAKLAAAEARNRELSEALELFREFALRNATQWQLGARHHHPIWEMVASLIEPTTFSSGPNYEFIQPGNRETLDTLRAARLKPDGGGNG